MDVPQFIAGRFRIEGEIGRGGMGTVYRATHLGLQRTVAVKIIKSEYANDSDLTDRFMREARTMARLRHPHAAIIFDAGNLPDGRHFIVMEYIEGVTLSEALGREGRFDPERAVKIAIQICEVLEDAHQLGIIHRDLKPANIMLNKRGVCVLDFGVAKVLASSADATTSQASTGSGQIIGTPRYMSPEQCLGQKVGARSDLYSLGVVLYEMLAGQPPFTDPVPSVVMVKQATAPPPPLPKLRADLSRSLSLAVHTLLAKRADDRPQTAAAARALLERSMASAPQPEPAIEPLPSTIAAASHSRSMVFRIAAPLLLVSIMGALLLVLGYGGPSAETAGPKQPAVVDLADQAAASGVATLSGTRTSDVRNDAVSAGGLQSNKARPANLSLEQARGILASRTEDSINDVELLQTTRGLAILAIQNAPASGLANFVMMERRGQIFRVTDRVSLDTSSFRANAWSMEKVSANDDARHQMLFSGVSTTQRHQGLRLVLYDPAARASYNLVVEMNGAGQMRRMQWSENTVDSRVAAFRVLLRDKARSIIARGFPRTKG